jgi:hypothetical protein
MTGAPKKFYYRKFSVNLAGQDGIRALYPTDFFQNVIVNTTGVGQWRLGERLRGVVRVSAAECGAARIQKTLTAPAKK